MHENQLMNETKTAAGPLANARLPSLACTQGRAGSTGQGGGGNKTLFSLRNSIFFVVSFGFLYLKEGKKIGGCWYLVFN